MESLSNNIFMSIYWVLFLLLRYAYLDDAFRGVAKILASLSRDEDIHAILRTPAILPFELLTLSTKKEESHVSCLCVC